MDKSRRPTCAKCRNHGVISPLKGHKRSCPFIECVCPNCVIIVQKRKVSSEQIAIRRRQIEDEATGVYLPVPENVLYGKGSNSSLAQNLHLLRQKFPKMNLGRLHAILKESGSLKMAVARLQREELGQDQHPHKWLLGGAGASTVGQTPVSSASFGLRPPLLPSNTKSEMATEYRYYSAPPPPLYNTTHMYSPLSSCFKSESMANPYWTNCESADFPSPPSSSSHFLLPNAQTGLLFNNVSSYNLGENNRNYAELNSIGSDDNNNVESLPSSQNSTRSMAFTEPDASQESSDEESNLMIDVDQSTSV